MCESELLSNIKILFRCRVCESELLLNIKILFRCRVCESELLLNIKILFRCRVCESELLFNIKILFRCRVCESELLFNLQGIRKHVRRAHNMSMDEYKVTYSPFTGGKGIRKGRPSKKKTLKELKLKKKRKAEEGERYMFHAMDDNELENKAGVYIFYDKSLLPSTLTRMSIK